MPGVHSQEGTVCGPCCWHDLQPGPAQTPLPARPGRTPSLTPPLLGPGGPAFHRTGRSRGGLSLGGGHKAAILRLTQDLASDGCGQGSSRTFYLCVPPPRGLFLAVVSGSHHKQPRSPLLPNTLNPPPLLFHKYPAESGNVLIVDGTAIRELGPLSQ